MSTQKQINANRKNAQKSTGPKTAEGKAAVSQNAVKHGLFADSVVFGENEADYEAFHDNMFAELAPVGVVEAVLAERAVSISWRLKRAERMQNEVIEDMIGKLVTTRSARYSRECYYYKQGRRPDEPGVDLDEMPLGRIAVEDFKYGKVLDRMLMYERRIENSLHKTLRELERRQLIRQSRQQEAEQEQSPSPRDEAATWKDENNGDLKKQTQFAPAIIGLTPFVKGFYCKESAGGEEKNKANQGQFCAPAKVEGAEKREKSQAAAIG